jgi:hypothetical protein
MTDQSKIGYHQLSAGFEFPPQSYQLEKNMVIDYLRAVGETNDLYQTDGLVPPLAITAFAMSALSEGLTLPSWTIHVSQELAFLALVRVGDTITCNSKVSRKIDRAGMHLMNVDITVNNQNQVVVLTGKVGFVLPEPNVSNQQ